jgi:RNA polymerase sigma factor (TIGR02999 family)
MARSGRAVVEPTVGDVTEVLRLAAGGDTEAQDRLFQLLVPTLRQMAAARMAHERPGHTLSPTALVNEAFVRLARQDKVPAENTSQLLGVFGITMRRVLADHWKKKHAAKNGGDWNRVAFDDVFALPQKAEEQFLAVHACLERLEKDKPRQAKVVELRFFCGLSNPEIAAQLGISLSTVEADWRFARVWLKAELEDL